MNTSHPDCIFCKIVAGDIPSTKVLETEDVLAFADIDPKAPVHVLVIPKDHVNSLAELEAPDQSLASHLLNACNEVAQIKGVANSGYRVITSVGEDGGQEVPHLHFHVVGGRKLKFSI